MTPKPKRKNTPERRPQPAPDEEQPRKRDAVEEASEQSFPASDSPSWSPLHPGTPGEHPDRERS